MIKKYPLGMNDCGMIAELDDWESSNGVLFIGDYPLYAKENGELTCAKRYYLDGSYLIVLEEGKSKPSLISSMPASFLKKNQICKSLRYLEKIK